MKNKKQLQKYFNNKYFSKNNNYKAILSKIHKEEKMNKSNIFRIIATTIITLLGTTGLVFASTKVYNEYIKKQDTIDSGNIFLEGSDENGQYYNFGITNDMTYDEKTDLYYKVITNIQDYNLFKNKENELPDMTEQNFEQEAIILIVNAGTMRQVSEVDLTISEVICNDQTTYITMAQKENPDYNSQHLIWYAIVDSSMVKDNIKLKIEQSIITTPSYISLNSLPDNYSIDDALKDGCFVEQNYEILSDNKYAIDELIEKAENGEESSLRIYSKSDDFVRVMDLSYKDNIFILNYISLGDTEINVMSAKYLTKFYYEDSTKYDYCFRDFDIPNYYGKPILIVNEY